MEAQLNDLQNLGLVMTEHGRQFILSLLVLILGILFTKWLVGKIKIGLKKITSNQHTVSIISNSISVFLFSIVISAAAVEAGAKARPVIALLMIITLSGIGILVLFRPLMPSLPFKVGNIIKAGDLLGKVETISFLNTRVRTFDGRTFFVPNRQIINEIILNYHFTDTRRVRVDLYIGYDQDLLLAKRTIESIMIGDPRIRTKPSPVVWVLELGLHGIKLGARCWTNNTNFWLTRVDLIEKIKFGLDNQGIKFARPQMNVHHFDPEESGIELDNPEEPMEEIEGEIS